MARNSDYRAGPQVAYERGTAVPPAAADRAARAAHGRDAGRTLRLLALIGVAVGLAALTAAACALSYSSIHRLAIEAGVSARLASIYPLIFDALLVVAGCSVLALRGAGLVSRIYGWFCLLVLLGGLAAGGAVHAAAIRIPRRLAGVIAAVVPWALVLIGFGLLLVLLRYVRIKRLGQRPDGADPQAGAVDPRAGSVDPRAGSGPPALSDVVVTGNTAAAPQGTAAPRAEAIAGAGGAAHPAAAPHAGSGELPEPETSPQPTIPIAPAAGAAPAAPGQGGQPEPDLAAAGPPRPAVRQADMQLRARIPRQPASHAAPGPVPEHHAPFMPPVGPLPAAAPEAAQQPDQRMADEQDADGGVRVEHEPPTNPGRPAVRQPAAHAAGPTRQQPAAAGPATAADAGPVTAADQQVAASKLNPAPTLDAGPDETGEPPALRRPHSSPTPPEED